MKDMIPDLIKIVRRAGEAILEVYNAADFSVEYKPDESPLTEADMRSNRIILEGLGKITPDIPIISEESKDVPYEQRSSWDKFWLVDPLDGTKEFINRNGEFTVNIALVEDITPVLGVILVPVKGDIFIGEKDKGSYRLPVSGEDKVRIEARKGLPEKLTAVASRSHLSDKARIFLENMYSDMINAGSALKFTLVAGGEADLYPRFGPTWEWDTAAGHAIAEAAGAVVCDLRGNSLSYNKKVLKHEGFLVCAPGVKDKALEEISNITNL